MRRYLLVVAILVTAVVVAAPGIAQEASGFRADLIGQIEFAQGEIMQLENAIPQTKMTWRPNKEVRSISEVYLHIAFGNYLLPKFAGIMPPESFTASTPADATKWEKSTTDKKKITEELTQSFDHLKEAVRKMSDADMEKEVTFFGQQTTGRGMLLTTLAHMNEHLGQSIANARMNNIVPPWTAAQQAAEAKESKKKD